MEKKEIEMINELIVKGNHDLKKLYEEHVSLDKRIEVLSNKSFLTPKEDLEFRNLKIQKLHGKEKILKILAQKK